MVERIGIQTKYEATEDPIKFGEFKKNYITHFDNDNVLICEGMLGDLNNKLAGNKVIDEESSKELDSSSEAVRQFLES